jgi:hypothetical protein
VERRERQNVRRAVEVSARKADTDADEYARKLQASPFWRFRRRQVLGRALADARSRAEAANRLLNDDR